MLIHKGIRPTGKILQEPKQHKNHGTTNIRAAVVENCTFELRPDNSIRIWTKRMLRSGCGYKIENVIKIDDLIYCERCQEYFSADQFEEVE